MTRKHFILLAEALATIRNKQDRENASTLIAAVCASSNPRFKPQQFFDYIEEQRKVLNAADARYERTYPE